MAETLRKRRIEEFASRLHTRKRILAEQLRLEVMQESRQFLQGELSAVDEILRQLTTEFNLSRRYEDALMPGDEIEEKEWLQAVSTNPAFAFLADPEEDIYTVEDGRPIAYDHEA